jgi:hypothetical protein
MISVGTDKPRKFTRGFGISRVGGRGASAQTSTHRKVARLLRETASASGLAPLTPANVQEAIP